MAPCTLSESLLLCKTYLYYFCVVKPVNRIYFVRQRASSVSPNTRTKSISLWCPFVNNALRFALAMQRWLNLIYLGCNLKKKLLRYFFCHIKKSSWRNSWVLRLMWSREWKTELKEPCPFSISVAFYSCIFRLREYISNSHSWLYIYNIFFLNLIF